MEIKKVFKTNLLTIIFITSLLHTTLWASVNEQSEFDDGWNSNVNQFDNDWNSNINPFPSNQMQTSTNRNQMQTNSNQMQTSTNSNQMQINNMFNPNKSNTNQIQVQTNPNSNQMQKNNMFNSNISNTNQIQVQTTKGNNLQLKEDDRNDSIEMPPTGGYPIKDFLDENGQWKKDIETCRPEISKSQFGAGLVMLVIAVALIARKYFAPQMKWRIYPLLKARQPKEKSIWAKLGEFLF